MLNIKESKEYSENRIIKEALTTPFICLNAKERPQANWKVRLLREDYCSLNTAMCDKPARCSFCLKDKPYTCYFKITAQELLFREVFGR